MTLLDLTGESPLSDHTAQGKAIHAVVIIIGVGLFTIPMSIFGSLVFFASARLPSLRVLKFYRKR